MGTKNKRVHSNWRTAAIIFGIILLLLGSLLIYGWNVASAKDKCINYCYYNEYESFTYDYSIDKCSCYIGSEIKEIIPIRIGS